MFFSVLHYLRGFLVLRLASGCPERFINLCVRRGIYLWNIRKESDASVIVCASIPGFLHMREAARKTNTRVRILKKCGLPLFLHKHRRRGAFAAGILLFILILTLLSSFIWAIEIDGTDKIDKNMLRNTLRTCGLDVGVLKYKLKVNDIKDEMLRKVPELSWLFVEVKGTRAFVHVREKTPVPEMVPTGRPSNIVAERDGVIISCTAARGAACVEEGDAVQKGALLISGTVETKHGTALLVHAEGTITARTWHTISGTFPLIKETETDFGESKNRYGVYFGKFYLPLYGKRAPYETYRLETGHTSLRLWGDLYLPITIEKQTLYRTDVEKETLSPEEAQLYFGKMLLEKMELPEDGEFINAEYTHILNGDGTITVECTAECIEEIGKTQEILEGTENDGAIF